MPTSILLLTACSIPLSVHVDTTCVIGEVKAAKDTKIWLGKLFDEKTKKPVELVRIDEIDGALIDMTAPESFSIFLQRVGRNNTKVKELCNAR